MRKLDQGPKPIVVAPSATVVDPGATLMVTVTMDTTSTTSTAVALYSNNVMIGVPPSVNVPAGQTTATFIAMVADDPVAGGDPTAGTVVRITAAANGGSAFADVTVE